MKRFGKYLASAALAAGTILGVSAATTTAADARVVVGVGIGVPGGYYGPGYYPPGPCYGYNYYYQGNCGYP
ncbi:MAG: peptidase, partial [Rhizomicrobium sp.]